MTDHRDPSGPDDPADSTPADVELSAEEFDALVARLRDIPTTPASVRTAHLAMALEAYDDLPVAPPAHDEQPAAPIALSSHRRRRQSMVQRWAVAAAVVLVAGLGIGFAASSNGDSDDSESDAADTQSNAEDQLSSESATEAAAAPLSGAAAAPLSGAAAADTADTAGVLQLGDIPDDDALRVALLSARRGDAAKSTRDAAPPVPDDRTGMAVDGSEAPVTTMAGRRNEFDACASAVPPGALKVAEGRVGGRPVVVVDVPGDGASPSAVATVIDLVDCSTRTL